MPIQVPEYNSASEATLPQSLNESGHYQTFAQFVTANSFTLQIQNEDTHAWDVYKHTIDNASEQGAAILYKLTDLNLHLTEAARAELGDGKDLKATGRQYHPSKHTWQVNAAWLLAQVHIGRPFTLVSTLSADYAMRSHPTRPDLVSVSALAREIAAVTKIYQFSGISSKGFIELTPKLAISAMQKITLKDINPERDEVLPAVMKLYADACENILTALAVTKEQASHALYYAVSANNADLVKTVLEKFSSHIDLGIVINGQSLLGIAAAAESTNIIESLLAAGADIEQINMPGHSPIIGAVLKKHWDFVVKILEHGKSHADPIKALKLNERNSAGNSIVHHAAADGRQDALQQLISIGVDISESNHIDESPMFTAAQHGHWHLTTSDFRAQGIKKEGVDFLIQNSPNRSGETLFILAVHQNKIDVIQLMLVLGVKNINQLTSNKDFNALLIAANSDHWEIVNTILEHGKALGDPLISLQLNHANIYGYTAAHYAAKSGKLDVLEFLQVAGADLNLQALNGHTPLSLATASGRDEVATYLQNLGYTVEPQQQAEIQNLAGLSLLFQAVTKNKCDQVKKMLDQKIEDINQVTANGLNALQLAAVYGHWEIVDMIFKHGELTGDPHNYLQLDHKNSYGYTIAHYAAKDGKLEVLRNLKAAGADLNIEALDRYTPLSLALYYNHTDVLREIFSIADKTTDESVSNQSDDSENTGAMLKSMTTHFLEKSSKNTGSYLPQRDLKERAVQENELLSHYKKK